MTNQLRPENQRVVLWIDYCPLFQLSKNSAHKNQERDIYLYSGLIENRSKSDVMY